MYDVVVLGAGIVGLSTAINIQKCIPGAQVTIIADRLLQETTSDGAAGMFRVTLGLTPTKSVDRFRQWCEDSFRWYHKLEREYDPTQTGVLRVSGYQINSTDEKNGKPAYFRVCTDLVRVNPPDTAERFDGFYQPMYAKWHPFHKQFMFNFRELTKEELGSIPGNHRYGWFYTTLMTESRRYLPWLTKLFHSNGGRIEQRTISNINEFAGNCRLLVNCAGYNSRKLFHDEEVYPVRGHLLRVKAPWVKHFYVFNNGETYIYPGQDNVILGGTRHRDEHDLTLKDHWFDDIRTRCSQLLPGLKDAEEERRWAGLRPHRSEIRVEPETIVAGGKSLHVVHNYGHGANGVALSWGTAVEAASIVKDLLEKLITKSRL